MSGAIYQKYISSYESVDLNTLYEHAAGADLVGHSNMDVAGAPLAIGIEAIKTLDNWLQTEATARAWYGDDRSKFCESTISGIRRRKKPKIRTVFTVRSGYWEMLIDNARSNCTAWYDQRNNGQCSWLPLYRSLGDGRGRFLENAESALSWIGTATSLPAARLDLWGIVTLGFADDGILRVVKDPSGTSYRATIHATHFTIVIRQESLNAPAVARITPHQHPHRNTTTVQTAWRILLHTGSSIERQDDLLSWLGTSPLEPPTRLLNGTWDAKIKEAVFDYHFTKEIEKELRAAVFKCFDIWEFGLESHPTDEFICRHATKILQSLRQSKVFLDCGGWRDYCEEISSFEDVLEYSRRHLKILKFHPAAKDGFCDNHIMRSAFEQHQIINSLLKLLLQPVRIPEQLSTRGTGEMVLLA